MMNFGIQIVILFTQPTDASDIVIGVEIGGAIEEGTARKIALPEMDKVENILRELGVTREFAWYAIHCVSQSKKFS